MSSIVTAADDHYRRLLMYEAGQTRRLKLHRMQRYILNRRYFYGENEDPDNLKQPLGIRYVPTINQKHTHYLFGEWENDIVNWIVRPWDAEKADDPDFEIASKIQRAIYRMLRRTDANQVIYKAALDGSIYGDSVLKVDWDAVNHHPVLQAVLPEYYHALWNPMNTSETLECCIAWNMDRTTANSLYGTVGNRQYFPRGTGLNTEMAIIWQYWNAYEMMTVVDDVRVEHRANPFAKAGPDGELAPGPLPFIHVPNLGINGEYWGFGDAENILLLADELNYRLADIGDVINYHAHPITLLRSFYGDLSKLPVSADAVWDLGREGEASYLEWGGPPPEVMAYVEMLLRMVMETSSLTPIAFGQTTSSQASSAALNIQMLPITEVVKRKRAFWGPALREAVTRMLQLESVVLESEAKGKFKKTYGFAFDDLTAYELQVKWAPILPRDRLAVVNEQVGLISNHARSIMYALQDLNVDNPEVERERILEDIKAIAEIEAELNKDMAEHEANLNMEMAEHQSGLDEEQMKLQMKQSAQEHKQQMAADPTTDPERHQRHIEQVKTEHAEERKTVQVKAQAAERIARVKAQRVKVKTGGQNSDRAKGKSNTDGGN